MSVTIREFVSDDFDDVLKLLSENWNVENFDRLFLDKIIASGQRMVIASVGGEVAGFLSVCFLYKFFWGGGIVALVEDVIVGENFRGNDIGDLMLDKAEEIAREVGCYKIQLTCSDGLINFYNRNGYEVYENAMKKILD